MGLDAESLAFSAEPRAGRQENLTIAEPPHLWSLWVQYTVITA